MPDTSAGQDFLVQRQALDRVQFHPIEPDLQALQPGQILLAVDRFAFTSNNITYAVTGDTLSYWKFFPTAPPWGQIPVWGFADVVASNSDAIAAGERIYGFLPMSTHMLARVGKVAAASFTESSAHRAALPLAYNVYLRCGGDPAYRQPLENLQALLRPLFTTSFLLDDFFSELLSDAGRAGGTQLILSSASSKTAFGTAFMLSRNRSGRPDYEVIGLTSPGNLKFVESLGCYDRVISYDQVTSLAQRPSAYIDMAGNGDVRSALHHHLREHMTYSCQVGAAHWDQASAPQDLPGAKPTLFFAPTQLQKRTQEWGSGQLQQRIAAAWSAFIDLADGSLAVVAQSGPQAIESVYRATLAGKASPDKGYILSF